eukprot:scaffold4062_cov131-Isochrysis_galbana.AAC.2
MHPDGCGVCTPLVRTISAALPPQQGFRVGSGVDRYMLGVASSGSCSWISDSTTLGCPRCFLFLEDACSLLTVKLFTAVRGCGCGRPGSVASA